MHSLDLTGSFIIGGIVLLGLLGLYMLVSNESHKTVSNEFAQGTLTELGQSIDYDFEKLGYRVSSTTKITSIDSISITFLSDINNDGVIDSIKYCNPVVGSDTLFSTMERKATYPANSKPWKLKVKKFFIAGLDSNGDTTYTYSQIKSILVQILLDNKSVNSGDKTQDVGAYWEKRYFPRNL